MSDRSSKPPGEVISLEEMRAVLRPDALEAISDPEEISFAYKPVDYSSFRMIQLMLEDITHEPADQLVVAHTVSDKPQAVSYSSENGMWFAVRQNRDDIEALTLELENTDEQTEALLKMPLERFYLASLVAARKLIHERKVNRRIDILPPMVEAKEINLHNRKDWLEVTTWRAAAGLGVLAVGRERPSLRVALRQHLRNVLSGRFHYLTSLYQFSELLGAKTPEMEDSDFSEVSNYFIGLCNPLYRSQLQKILNDPDN